MAAPTININPTAISKTALKTVIKAAWETVKTHLTALYNLIEGIDDRLTVVDTIKQYRVSFTSAIEAVAPPVATGIVADGEDGDNPTTIKIKITTVTADGETAASNEVTAELTDDTTEAILSWEAAAGATKYRVYYKYDADATYAGYIETADETELTMDVSGTLTPDEAEQPPAVSDAGTTVIVTPAVFLNTTGGNPTFSNPSPGVIEMAHPSIWNGMTFVYVPVFSYTNDDSEVIRVVVEKGDEKFTISTSVDTVKTDGVLTPDLYTLAIDLYLPESPGEPE